MSLSDIQAAASRARTLCTDLERSNNVTDQHQVAAGVRHELDTILRAAHLLQEAAVDAATANHPGKVRLDAPATSRAAAQAITVKTGTTRWRIVELLGKTMEPTGYWSRRFQGGCTDYELQQQLKLNPSTERPRRGELVDAGLVREHGTRVHGTPPLTQEWTVWSLTQKGADLYREQNPGTQIIVTRTGEPTLF